ncbi:MAG: phenylacetate-CoA oxygenase subunit PaaC [Melioribacteraceae bacterium]|nr:phenylacetate-CoA oxygenase subunit PaaC [Melioribacteraceae bacterium]MCF8263740.1 phenylacetate-CoA oxygenase subunit PaaC [Melioribacteraceae bacterium]MCF8412680.1 phenylacetate-CoA oxygenase subunit PaaC [Melioribacteraceae bacterium]MCF8430974.1 phenylacetate-CoA oxygenase subunit PaaC [Melioribacteraceae bacterium]
MSSKISNLTESHLFEYLLRLGDDRLILGHRLSEWCGHGPILEEDIALANVALDCVGQAKSFLSLAGKVENKGRTEDDLSYFREAVEFRNLQLLEQPNIDFAYTIARQFFYDVYSYFLYEELSKSSFDELAGLAVKSLKEVKYHVRHSREWILRLGDGTEESHAKIQEAVNERWRFTNELFEDDIVVESLSGEGVVVKNSNLKTSWNEFVTDTFEKATIVKPVNVIDYSKGSRIGNHSEYLGHLLAEMQIVARSFPDAEW